MKRLIYIITSAVILSTACQRELSADLLKAHLQADSAHLNFPASFSPTDSFHILSNIEWTIAVTPSTSSWLTVSQNSGTGNAKIYVSAILENTGDTARQAIIVLSAVSDSTVRPVEIIVTQQQQNADAVRNVYGGADADEFFSIVPATDGGFVAVGITESRDGDVSGSNSRQDVWVVRVDATGKKIWQRPLGGAGRDFGFEIITTADGGYIIAGTGEDNGGDITGNNGYADAWILKLDAYGTLKWQQSIGGADFELVSGIVPAPGGGYVAAGFTISKDGDIPFNKGVSDFLVVKISEAGSIVWVKTFGGTSAESASSICAAHGGGYIIAGQAQSNDGDVSGNHGFDDAWLIKIDENGNLVWQKAYGGSDADLAGYVTQSNDGGYVFAGYTKSNDGDVSGNHGNGDVWLVKTDANGTISWQKTYGGSDLEVARYVRQAKDGGYLLAGYTKSNDGDIVQNRGTRDAWVIKADANGTLIWERALGGSDEDFGYHILEMPDGSYVLAGSTFSSDGDIIGAHGYIDAWIFKFRH